MNDSTYFFEVYNSTGKMIKVTSSLQSNHLEKTIIFSCVILTCILLYKIHTKFKTLIYNK
jgi:hypothetical protein